MQVDGCSRCASVCKSVSSDRKWRGRASCAHPVATRHSPHVTTSAPCLTQINKGSSELHTHGPPHKLGSHISRGGVDGSGVKSWPVPSNTPFADNGTVRATTTIDHSTQQRIHTPLLSVGVTVTDFANSRAVCSSETEYPSSTEPMMACVSLLAVAVGCVMLLGAAEGISSHLEPAAAPTAPPDGRNCYGCIGWCTYHDLCSPPDNAKW